MCAHQFYTKSPKTIAGSAAESAIVPPVVETAPAADEELQLEPEAPPSRYQSPPSLPESATKKRFNVAEWVSSAGSSVAVVGLIAFFAVLAFSIVAFAPRFVQVAKDLPQIGPAQDSTRQDFDPARPAESMIPNWPANRSRQVPAQMDAANANAASSRASKQVMQEFIELQTMLVKKRQSFSYFDSSEVLDYWSVLDRAELQSRELLKRALESQPCSRAVFSEFESECQRLAILQRSLATTAIDELPPVQQALMRKSFSEKELIERAPYLTLLQSLVLHGYVETAETTTNLDSIRSDQVNLLRMLNSELIMIESETDLSLVAPHLERAADDLIELAVRRSGESSSAPIKRRVEDCLDTHRMLAFRLLRMAETEYPSTRVFANAAVNFHEADGLLTVARHFTASELRKKMADARRKQQGLGPQEIPSLASAMQSADGSSSSMRWNAISQLNDPSNGGSVRSPQAPSNNARTGNPRIGGRSTLPFQSGSRVPGLPSDRFRGPPSGFANRAREAFEARQRQVSRTGVAYLIFEKPVDPVSVAKQISKRLGVPGWSMTTSNNECRLTVTWGGPIDLLVQKLGEDTVIQSDADQRRIRIRVE